MSDTDAVSGITDISDATDIEANRAINDEVSRYFALAKKQASKLHAKCRFMDAEDLEGQAMLELVLALREYDPAKLTGKATKGQFLGRRIHDRLVDYIHRVAGKKFQRIGVLRPLSLSDLMYEFHGGDNGQLSIPCKEPVDNESTGGLARILKLLPVRQRIVIRCKFLGNQRQRDAVEFIDVSETMVVLLKRQAVEELRELGEDEVREILFGRGK